MYVYLACFDISEDRIRYRVGRELEHYGLRVQRSVFEIHLRGRDELADLSTRLGEMLEVDDDLRFYALCKSCQGHSADSRGAPIGRIAAAVIV